jgi:hypothetical protein
VKKSAGLEVRGENMSEKIECLGCNLAKNHPLEYGHQPFAEFFRKIL